MTDENNKQPEDENEVWKKLILGKDDEAPVNKNKFKKASKDGVLTGLTLPSSPLTKLNHNNILKFVESSLHMQKNPYLEGIQAQEPEQTIKVRIRILADFERAGKARINTKTGTLEVFFVPGFAVQTAMPNIEGTTFETEMTQSMLSDLKDMSKNSSSEEGLFNLDTSHEVFGRTVLSPGKYKDADIGYTACRHSVPRSHPNNYRDVLDSERTQLMPEDWDWANNPAQTTGCICPKIMESEGTKTLADCQYMPNQTMCMFYEAAPVAVKIKTKDEVVDGWITRTINPHDATMRRETFKATPDGLKRHVVQDDETISTVTKEEEDGNNSRAEASSPLDLAKG